CTELRADRADGGDRSIDSRDDRVRGSWTRQLYAWGRIVRCRVLSGYGVESIGQILEAGLGVDRHRFGSGCADLERNLAGQQSARAVRRRAVAEEVLAAERRR